MGTTGVHSIKVLTILWSLIVVTSSLTPEEIDRQILAFNTSEKNNQFAVKLYHGLRNPAGTFGAGPQNLIVSPFSLRTVMAMLQTGAEGETATEIRDGMLFPENTKELVEGYHALLTMGNYVKSSKRNTNPTYPVSIEQANRIYTKRGFEIVGSFIHTLNYYFQSTIEKLDFTNGKKAATLINNWVAGRTNNKIQKLVESDSLNNFTKVVLVNTLYFKGPWENKFHGRLTKKKFFHIDESRSVPVDMMSTEDYFPVMNIDSLDAKAIVLPYEGSEKRFHMTILLPNEKFGLDQLEQKLKDLSNSQLSDVFKAGAINGPKNIILNIPKFTIESSYDLIDVMKQLNITKVFNENESDLTGIAKTDETLFVSKLVQKAFITVEEQGTEAGSATYGAVFTPLSIGPAIDEEITIDHPFMGFVYDSKYDLVLFMFRKSKF